MTSKRDIVAAVKRVYSDMRLVTGQRLYETVEALNYPVTEDQLRFYGLSNAQLQQAGLDYFSARALVATLSRNGGDTGGAIEELPQG